MLKYKLINVEYRATEPKRFRVDVEITLDTNTAFEKIMVPDTGQTLAELRDAVSAAVQAMADKWRSQNAVEAQLKQYIGTEIILEQP